MRTDIDDLVARDRNVANERSLVGAAVDRSAADDEIGGVGGGCSVMQHEAYRYRGKQNRDEFHSGISCAEAGYFSSSASSNAKFALDARPGIAQLLICVTCQALK